MFGIKSNGVQYNGIDLIRFFTKPGTSFGIFDINNALKGVESFEITGTPIEKSFLEAFVAPFPKAETIVFNECRFLKYFKGYLPSVKKIDFSDNERLEKIDIFDKLDNLEEANFKGCEKLTALPDAILNAPNLKHINLEHCRSLVLPEGTLQSLRDRGVNVIEPPKHQNNFISSVYNWLTGTSAVPAVEPSNQLTAN